MRWFVRRDLDGFFGLFVDNLVQLLLIVALCGSLCGMTGDHAYLLFARILPGAGLSVLGGNLFYAWQARRLARREGRDDVTAIPYGINTPSLLVYTLFVILPVYQKSGDPELAWQMGLLACAGSGLIELLGSVVAERIRKGTPRAALLSTLAGIAIGFISMTFCLRIWSSPLIAFVPLAIVLMTYFSDAKFPFGLPGGLVAIVAGSLLAWILPSSWTGTSMSVAAASETLADSGLRLPVWCGGALLDALRRPPEEWLGFISVIVPMGMFNVIGSLQNIESAEAAGDRYDTRSSLAANGVGTIAAALLGSCYPTTIYIGHPGWKGLGARAGYSIINGIAMTLLCLTGTVAFVNAVVPIETGMAIVLWIGVIITAQAFQATKREHAPAVAIGLFPAIAGWGAMAVIGAFLVSGGTTVQSVLEDNRASEVSGFALHGLIVLERGYIFTCMVLAAVAARLIDGKFFGAALWCLGGAAVTFIGLAHAYQLSGNTVDYLLAFAPVRAGTYAYRAWDIAIGYVVMACVLIAAGIYRDARRNRNRLAQPQP